MNPIEKKVLNVLNGKIYILTTYMWSGIDLKFYKAGKKLLNAKQVWRAERLILYKRENGFLRTETCNDGLIYRLTEFFPAWYREPLKYLAKEEIK